MVFVVIGIPIGLVAIFRVAFKVSDCMKESSSSREVYVNRQVVIKVRKITEKVDMSSNFIVFVRKNHEKIFVSHLVVVVQCPL